MDHAQALLEENSTEAVDKFIQLVLAGRLTVAGEERRVFINPRQNAVFPTKEQCTLTGDFDSLIGFSKSLPLRVPVGIYPIPDFKFTLKSTIHVTLPVPYNQVF